MTPRRLNSLPIRLRAWRSDYDTHISQILLAELYLSLTGLPLITWTSYSIFIWQLLLYTESDFSRAHGWRDANINLHFILYLYLPKYFIHTFIHWWWWLPCKVLTSTLGVLGFSILPKYSSTCRPRILNQWASDNKTSTLVQTVMPCHLVEKSITSSAPRTLSWGGACRTTDSLSVATKKPQSYHYQYYHYYW